MTTECPTCRGGLITSDVTGEFCSKCGLIISTITNIFPKVGKIRTGRCSICKEINKIQQHHIVPKRLGLKTRKISLCPRCHKIADLIANTIYPKDIIIE